MDDEIADEFWRIIGDNEVFVETLNSNWRDLYNKLVVQFSDKKRSKSAIFNFIRNYIGGQTQFLNKQGAVERKKIGKIKISQRLYKVHYFRIEVRVFPVFCINVKNVGFFWVGQFAADNGFRCRC
jgi:hypothetical protein